MVKEQRTAQFGIRITPSELEMIRELAEHSGLSAADIVRQLVRREHAKVLGKPSKVKGRAR